MFPVSSPLPSWTINSSVFFRLPTILGRIQNMLTIPQRPILILHIQALFIIRLRCFQNMILKIVHVTVNLAAELPAVLADGTFERIPWEREDAFIVCSWRMCVFGFENVVLETVEVALPFVGELW
jgi:hypothetical protein